MTRQFKWFPFFKSSQGASHLTQTSGNWKCQSKEIFLFQNIDQIMSRHTNREQNILRNYLTPDKKSGNTFN